MCSFLATNSPNGQIAAANHFQQFRGPDLTNTVQRGAFSITHNLLSITGIVTPQPFSSGQISAFFNGEIYNYTDFGTYSSDGEVLIPLYEEFGAQFVKKLDGEFAIVIIDEKQQIITLSTDVFGTKPLWYAFASGRIAVASYASAVRGLGFSAPERIPPNTWRTYKIATGEILDQGSLYTFALNQHKKDYSDFIRAFEHSIHKRSVGLTKKVFVGLSSGYDSGAIAAELKQQGREFKVFSINDGENADILEERIRLHTSVDRFSLGTKEFVEAKHYLKRYTEESHIDILPGLHAKTKVSDNTGAIGLSAICLRARRDGYRVLFSGQGADEIFSDYGFNGVRFTKHSSFGGKFPDTLETVFPWRNFWGGAQRAYLDKEEVVAGSHGIETRYPFLDVALVQEFLWLSPELKNAEYKAPIAAYLRKVGYPFDNGIKQGFAPRAPKRFERLNPLVLLYECYWKVLSLTRTWTRMRRSYH